MPTDVIVVAVSAHDGVVLHAVRIQREAVVVRDWERLEEFSEGGEFDGRVFCCSATACVDED